ncbi:unnamed protein product [Mytilus coruscus]|uniref:SWIM-type domain-containing protein n=1 Tax=Mytilus coruscus TaxID=42192 RepID=A0A6J8EVH0_MYTCO|nr:unnamed protein product [Mytilus coruscus]
MSENDTSIDTFKRWTVPVLQQYLRIRGLRTSGKKRELVALVYSANLMQIKQVLTPAEERKLKADQYCDKLKAPKESKGVSMWPPTMYYDIATFLQKKEDKSLSDRLMKDYKEGKAYSNFTSGWLKEVCYHHIDNNSPYCFLKAECTASQRINDVPHTTWVLLEKVSGEIQTAYCTCFAGLGETCNHMAAILFKVDYAWQWGANNKSCTSKPCVWKSPSTKKFVVQPTKLSELKIMKPHYSKGGQGQPINPIKRQLFQPTQGSKSSLGKLSDALLPACQNAAVFQYIHHKYTNYEPSEDFNVLSTETVTTTEGTILPLSLPETDGNCHDHNELLEKLKYTDADREKILQETCGQSENTEWFNQRKGRITCSRMHSVFTKSETLKKNNAVNIESLVSEILGYKEKIVISLH